MLNRYWNALHFRVGLYLCRVIGASLERACKGDYCCLRARTASTGTRYVQWFPITLWMLFTQDKNVCSSLLINGAWSISILKLGIRSKGRLSPMMCSSHVIQAWRRPSVSFCVHWAFLCLGKRFCTVPDEADARFQPWHSEGFWLVRDTLLILGLMGSVLPPWQHSEVQPESLLAWKECEQAWARAWA